MDLMYPKDLHKRGHIVSQLFSLRRLLGSRVLRKTGCRKQLLISVLLPHQNHESALLTTPQQYRYTNSVV